MMLSSNWIPVWSFFKLLENIGLSLWFINRTIFLLPLFTLSLSFYMLLRHFGKSRIASLLSSLFFAANPIIGTRLAFGQAWILVELSGVVLFISFFAYEIRKKNLIIISAILLSLCTLPITFLDTLHICIF